MTFFLHKNIVHEIILSIVFIKMRLSLLFFNCRGLHGIEKRRDAVNFLKQKQKLIYFFKDTHFTENDVNMVRSCNVGI